MSDSENADIPKPLAGEVKLYQKPTYTVVKFLLQNPRDNPVLVTMRQTLPESVDDSQVTFADEYNGDAWELDGEKLTFQRKFDGEELIETAYGTRDISLETLQQQIRVSTITITNETGEQLGTVTGLQPTIAEKCDEAEQTTDENEMMEADGSESKGANEGVELEENSDEIDKKSTESVDEDEQSATETSEEDSGDESSAPEQERAIDGTERAVESSEEGAEKTPETESVGAEASDSKREGKPDEQPQQEAVTADLPANRSDYILEDVRDKIESPDEFDWQPVGEQPQSEGGVIGWLKAVFGY